MSQVYKDLTAGPVPPTVATTYVTDSGNAVPAANILNVVTPGGGTQGIMTTGAGNTITIILDDLVIDGNATTVGAVTADVITFPLGATPGVYTFDAKTAGFTTAGGPLGTGYTLVGSVRTTGAAATLLPSQALDSFEEGALSAGTFVIAVSGNSAIFRVTGTAGTTINWRTVAEYVFIS